MNDKPRRAYVFNLQLEADSRNDIIGALRQLEFEIAADQLTEGVSGGYGSGYTYKLEVDETISHDDYFDALNVWLAAQKTEPQP